MVKNRELDSKDIGVQAHDLSKSMERVKTRYATLEDVVVNLRQSQCTRLELLAVELQPVFEQVPDDNDQFAFVLTNGETPRLWLDLSSHVRMGSNYRQYQLVKDTRMGRAILASTDDINRMRQAVTDYIAGKMLERERLIEGEWIAIGGRVFDGDRKTGGNAIKFVSKRSRWRAMGWFVLSAIISVGALFAVTIVLNNDTPEIVKNIEDVTFAEDTTIMFSIPGDLFRDADGDQLAFAARLSNGMNLPDWLLFEASTRTFSGTPPANMVGSLSLAIVASDSIASTIGYFNLFITGVNDAPKLSNPIKNQSFVEKQPLSIQIEQDIFTDIDGDDLILTANLADGSTLPVWLSFDADNQIFSGTPPYNSAQIFDIAVTASDGELEASDTFTLEITGSNDAPVVAMPLIDRFFVEDEAFSFTIPRDIFSDVDGDTLTLSAMLKNGSPLLSWLSFDGVVFSGIPPQNFNGLLSVVVVANDGIASVTDNFLITIEAVNDAPVLINSLIAQSFNEDEVVSFTLPTNTFGDADGDKLALSATLSDGSAIPAWLTFQGGTFTGRPPQDFNGILQFKVTATDKEFLVADSFQLRIDKVNDAPTVANWLIDQSAFEENMVSFIIPNDTFSDVDGDNLTLSATLSDGSVIPTWLSFDGFAFIGTPPLNFNGVLALQVTASDGVLETSSSFNLTIANQSTLKNIR